MFFTEEYVPRFDDYDSRGRFSLEAMFKVLENISNHHAMAVSDRAIRGSIAWILVEWRLQVTRLPKFGETFSASTWAHSMSSGTTTNRDYQVMDLNGGELIRARAKFALFDLKAGRLTGISEDLMDTYKPEEKAMFCDELPRLREPEEYDEKRPILLRRSDIDINGHVHNTRYLDFALEALTEDVYRTQPFGTVRIVYRSPLKFTEDAFIGIKRTEEGYIFGIYSGDRLCSLIELK